MTPITSHVFPICTTPVPPTFGARDASKVMEVTKQAGKPVSGLISAAIGSYMSGYGN